MFETSDRDESDGGAVDSRENSSSRTSFDPFEQIKRANSKVKLLDVLAGYGIKLVRNPQRPRWSENITCPLPSHKSAKERTASFGYCFQSDHFHCFAGETKVLTPNGSTQIRELVGTTQKVLGKDSNWVDADFKSYGKQQLWKLTVTRNGQIKEIYTTDKHRWFVRCGGKRKSIKEVFTKDLKDYHRLAYVFPRCHTSQMVLSPFGIAHGIVFGDGTANISGSFAYLVGDKDHQLKKWFPLNTITPDTSRNDKIIIHNLPRFFKKRPPLDEAAQYLFGWLAGYFAADGCVADDGSVSISSADYENLEFVRTVCTRLGIGTFGITGKLREGFPGRKPSWIYNLFMFNENLVPEFFLIDHHRQRFESNIKKYTRRGWCVKSVEITDRFEEVYCAEVNNGHAFALEDNILTGNCLGCGQSGRAVEFMALKDGVPRGLVAERILAMYGDDPAKDITDTYQDNIYPVLLSASSFFNKLIQEHKSNKKAIIKIEKLLWWLDSYLAVKVPVNKVSPEDLSFRIEKAKELLVNELSGGR